MSHGRERTEKNCLNCGTIVQGRYCQHCGQENIEPKESFWQLLNHFFNDITHFDGKFFHSLKYLVTRPGFLPKEYLAGRRARYLNPIRMYIFTSAFFFLLFFSFFNDEREVDTKMIFNNKGMAEINAMDSATFAAFTAYINKDDGKAAVPMTRAEFKHYSDSIRNTIGIHFTSGRYKSKEEYDSLLKKGVKKHNWVQRQLIYKEISLNRKYKNDQTRIFTSLRDTLFHSLPQMLFISLPLLALILKLVYIRRKQFYYISHLIFAVYLYIFIFLLLLLLFSIAELNGTLHWGFLCFLSTVLVIWIFLYQYLALYRFYRQGWFKTFIKFLLINILFVILLGLLFLIFVFFSLFKI